MEDIIDLIAADSSASDISDKIKAALYSKAADRIDLSKPNIATSLFDNSNYETSDVEDTQDNE